MSSRLRALGLGDQRIVSSGLNREPAAPAFLVSDPPEATAQAPGHRRLLQKQLAADDAPRVAVRRRVSLTARSTGFPGAEPAANATAPTGAASIAVGGGRAVHVTDSHMAVYSLAPDSGLKAAELALVRLQDLFSPVASSNCFDGVFDGHAAYDAAARRFYVAAACGGTGSALLAVSATAEPAGAWYVYNLNFDGVGTGLACANGESLLADYPRLQFNADALAVSVHTRCASEPGAPGARGAGAAVTVVPKGAAASGDMRMATAVFTSHDVAAAAGAGVAAAAVVQLEPALPQGEGDVAQGTMYFVADVSIVLAGGGCVLEFVWP
jgi:hypothetical protein